MENLNDVLTSILEQETEYISTDGVILRNSVYEAGQRMDRKLLKLLLSNDTTKKYFFTNIDGIFVFDKVKFGWVINNKSFLPDSYTRFKNKIGLVDGNEKFISQTRDISLVFPYKDCILEGGQTKDDQKRQEIFYNTLLAPDEVNRLLYPKVFTNITKYNKDGGGICSNIEENDNLIIKGNNLLALSSLEKRYRGKIKCIYIDPPYYFQENKAQDTFEYNSNFKLSTWLVFIKNRLEIARRLLRDDGAIFVQINDYGVAELHQLLKEIFGNNFINKITIKTKSPSGFSSVNPGVFETAEYILLFAKNKKKWKYNPQYTESNYDENYKWYICNKKENYKKWEIINVFEFIAREKGYKSKKEAILKLGGNVFGDMVSKFVLEHADCVFRYTTINDNAGKDIVQKRIESKENPNEFYCVKRDDHYDIYIHNGQELAFYSKKIRNIDGNLVPSIQVSNIWTDTPYEGIAKEGNVTLKGGKKPEKLLRRILEMSTNEGDLVLDFYLGSGTTCAVAHKLNRRYIGIEQLDYGKNDSLTRVKNVIKGDNSGISKVVNWQGGGSFIYCELAKLNQNFVDDIQEAKTTDALWQTYQKMVQTGYISCKVYPSEINAAVNDFKELSLDEQKQFLMEILDKNLLYVNYCDMDDEEYHISETDKEFTNSFYGKD